MSALSRAPLDQHHALYSKSSACRPLTSRGDPGRENSVRRLPHGLGPDVFPNDLHHDAGLERIFLSYPKCTLYDLASMAAQSLPPRKAKCSIIIDIHMWCDKVPPREEALSSSILRLAEYFQPHAREGSRKAQRRGPI